MGCGPPPSTAGQTSSDGLVFVRVNSGSTDVMLARIGDGAVRPITATADRDERWPYWSDAARQLIFQVGERGAASRSDFVLWERRLGACR